MSNVLVDLDEATQMVFVLAQKMALHIPVFGGSKQHLQEMHETAARECMRVLMNIFTHDCPMNEKARNLIATHYVDQHNTPWFNHNHLRDERYSFSTQISNHLLKGNFQLSLDTTNVLHNLHHNKGSLLSAINEMMGLNNSREDSPIDAHIFADPRIRAVRDIFDSDRSFDWMLMTSEDRTPDRRAKTLNELTSEQTTVYHQLHARNAQAGDSLLDLTGKRSWKATSVFDFYQQIHDPAWITAMDNFLISKKFELTNFYTEEYVEQIKKATLEIGELLLWSDNAPGKTFIKHTAKECAELVAKWSIAALKEMSAAAALEHNDAVSSDAPDNDHVTIETEIQDSTPQASIHQYRDRKHLTTDEPIDDIHPPTP